MPHKAWQNVTERAFWKTIVAFFDTHRYKVNASSDRVLDTIKDKRNFEISCKITR